MFLKTIQLNMPQICIDIWSYRASNLNQSRCDHAGVRVINYNQFWPQTSTLVTSPEPLWLIFILWWLIAIFCHWQCVSTPPHGMSFRAAAHQQLEALDWYHPMLTQIWSKPRHSSSPMLNWLPCLLGGSKPQGLAAPIFWFPWLFYY